MKTFQAIEYIMNSYMPIYMMLLGMFGVSFWKNNISGVWADIHRISKDDEKTIKKIDNRVIWGMPLGVLLMFPPIAWAIMQTPMDMTFRLFVGPILWVLVFMPPIAWWIIRNYPVSTEGTDIWRRMNFRSGIFNALPMFVGMSILFEVLFF